MSEWKKYLASIFYDVNHPGSYAGPDKLYLTVKSEGKLVYFMSIDKARFRKPVTPGDTVYAHVTKKQNRGSVWQFTAEAKVDGAVVAEAVYAAMIMDE